jgi:hypothetical protein
VQDAARAVGSFLGKVEMAFEVLVEGHAVAEQILDAAARLAGEQHGDLIVDDACAGADGVGGVSLRAVAFGQRRGDACLRPDARSALAEGRDRDDGDRHRRELERGEEAGKPRADNDDAAAFRPARNALESRSVLTQHRTLRPWG